MNTQNEKERFLLINTNRCLQTENFSVDLFFNYKDVTMKKMKEVPVRDRPREKIASKGASVLSDNELIEAIIGRGTRNKDVREISKEIGLLVKKRRKNLQYQDLQEVEGIGPTKASQIIACFELGRRYFEPAGTEIKGDKTGRYSSACC